MSVRPKGVTILAWLFTYPAIYGIFQIISYFIMRPIQSQTIFNYFGSIFFYSISVGMDPMTSIFLYGTIIFQELYSINQFSIVYAYLLILSLLSIFTIIGLLRMKRWGRYLALIMGILYIMSGVVPVILGIETYVAIGIGLIIAIFGVVIIVYLMGDVKYEFE